MMTGTDTHSLITGEAIVDQSKKEDLIAEINRLRGAIKEKNEEIEETKT